MALIKCECGNEISDQALKCPYCGRKKRRAKTGGKNKKGIKTGLLILTGIIGIIVISAIIVSLDWQSIFKTVTPIPVIVSEGSDPWASSLTDYRLRIWAEIRNDGSSGNILFIATVYEGEDKKWTKSMVEHFDSEETKKLELIFSEVTLLKSSSHRYSVKAYPFGK